MELNQEDKKKFEVLHKEMKKYLKEDKKKKAYSLYLTEEDVEIIKKRIKQPLSKLVDEFLRMMSKSFQQMDKLEEERKLSEKENGNKKE